jgi:CheY-like chemotaxis protein
MSHLLPFIDTRLQFETTHEPPSPPEPQLPPTKNINASTKTALLVENDESLLSFLRSFLKSDGYAVRTAKNSEEGLRLYRDCAPFNVVLINYCVPLSNAVGIDYLAPQQPHGIGLAIAIRQINPSQGIIIAALAYRNAGEVPRPPELMHIPFITEARNSQLRSLLEKIEVDRMIEMLTTKDWLKLQKFADFRVRGLGGAARGRTGQDLLGDALLRTLIGAESTQKGRHWNKDVDFVWHLTGAMRSISTCWKRQFKETEPHLISEFPVHDAGEEHSLLDSLASQHAAADQRLIEQDEEDRVLAMFKHDPEATQVLQGLLDGLKKNAIMPRYGLDERRYAATVRRIRVKLLDRRNGVDRGDDHDR